MSGLASRPRQRGGEVWVRASDGGLLAQPARLYVETNTTTGGDPATVTLANDYRRVAADFVIPPDGGHPVIDVVVSDRATGNGGCILPRTLTATSDPSVTRRPRDVPAVARALASVGQLAIGARPAKIAADDTNVGRSPLRRSERLTEGDEELAILLRDAVVERHDRALVPRDA